MKLGEAIHGGPIEKKILETIEKRVENYKRNPVETKFWKIEREEVYVNNKRIEASLLPYTIGCVKGKIGREITIMDMPSHPFYLSQPETEALLVVDSKLRRISLSKNKPVSFIIKNKIDGYVEMCGEGKLEPTTSYNLEIIRKDGSDFITVGAHVDHWLSGFHDNLFGVALALSLKPKLKNHGFKIVFFSSEEGPRCCTGSLQQPKEKTFVMISLDALFPNRVVFSATPDLWEFSKFFRLKRREMPSPFSDHFPYVAEGYPAMVLYNDDLIPYYHSDQDLPIDDDISYFNEMKISLEKMIESIDEKDSEYLDIQFYKYSGIEKRKGVIVPDYKNLTSRFKT
jgi:Iap family predicted aminopeptidase